MTHGSYIIMFGRLVYVIALAFVNDMKFVTSHIISHPIPSHQQAIHHMPVC